MSIKIRQETQYKGHDWWNWSVWLDGRKTELDQIDHVVYTLHPTFANPVREVSDRKTNFRLASAGWGGFEIYIDLFLKNGQRRKRKHELKLQYTEPSKGNAGETRSRAARSRAEGEGKRKARLFLSSGLADRWAAQALRAALDKRGVDVSTAEDSPAGLPWEKSVDAMLRQADAAVFMISGHPSPYVERELKTALDRKVGVIVPVLLGPEARLPTALGQFQIVSIDDASDIERAADQIAKQSLSAGA